MKVIRLARLKPFSDLHCTSYISLAYRSTQIKKYKSLRGRPSRSPFRTVASTETVAYFFTRHRTFNLQPNGRRGGFPFRSTPFPARVPAWGPVSSGERDGTPLWAVSTEAPRPGGTRFHTVYRQHKQTTRLFTHDTHTQSQTHAESERQTHFDTLTRTHTQTRTRTHTHAARQSCTWWDVGTQLRHRR
jgi:hypothetical protein